MKYYVPNLNQKVMWWVKPLYWWHKRKTIKDLELNPKGDPDIIAQMSKKDFKDLNRIRNKVDLILFVPETKQLKRGAQKDILISRGSGPIPESGCVPRGPKSIVLKFDAHTNTFYEFPYEEKR